PWPGSCASPIWPRPSSAPAGPSRSTTTSGRSASPSTPTCWPPSTRRSTGWSGPDAWAGGVTRPGGADDDLIVVVPSISFPVVELLKIAGVQSYEERMLFLLLLLADPAVRIVYVTSEAVDPATVDYYLRFLPDPGDGRRRLTMLSVGDPSIGSLSAKLLARPDDLERLRAAVGDHGHARGGGGGLLPFHVTHAEQDL